MTWRVRINRLSKEKLTNEARIREMAVGTVDEMRSAVSLRIRLEKSGDTVSLIRFILKMNIKLVLQQLWMKWRVS